MKLARRVLAVGFAALVTLAAAPPVARQPALEWERLYGDEGYEQELVGIAAVGPGAVTLLGQGRKEGSVADLSSRRLLLLGLAADGKVEESAQLQRHGGEKEGGATFGEVRDLAVLPDSRLAVLMTVDGGAPAILTLDRTGKEISFQRLTELTGVELQKLLPSPAGGYVLLGQLAGDFFLARIDASGKLLWRKAEDAGAFDVLFDGIRLDRDELVVVGESGNYDMLGRGPSQVWVRKYSAAGQLVAQVNFPGRRGRLGSGDGGQFFLVYDQDLADGQRVLLQAMTRQRLSTVWSLKILDADKGYSTFRLASGPSGSLIVAGAKEEKPYVVTVDRQGRRQGEFWGRDLLPADEYSVAVVNGGAFIGSSVFAPASEGRFRQRMRLFKLTLG